jgi:Asp-tRNA(Asn)/Glu-tRNA(Gln) amidotransferase A subunit family amidase
LFNSPVFLSLADMIKAVQNRKISPLELVDAHLAQIEKEQPRLNGFVAVYRESARQQAKQATDALTRTSDLSPLHGIPVTIKDSFDIAGEPTLCGSRFRSSHVARTDSTAVARLRAAGAIILGKTNTPEFLNNYETDNFITGRTNHPLDPRRTAGGSSGGEAAAIASYCSPGGMGSDGGGSIRVPAHYCGIAGLKPTPGRVSAAGHFPEIAHPAGLLGVGGPMARTVEDVSLLYSVVAGHDWRDPFSAPVPVSHSAKNLQTIGVWFGFEDVRLDSDIRSAIERTAEELLAAGYRVEPFQPQGLERARELWWFFFERIFASFTRELIRGREHDAHWSSTDLMYEALEQPQPSGSEIVSNLIARDQMRTRILEQMEEYPILLAPVCTVTAPLHHTLRGPELHAAMSPSSIFNLLGMPGLAVPRGRSTTGMPIGIQLVGRPWDEWPLLTTGMHIERE